MTRSMPFVALTALLGMGLPSIAWPANPRLGPDYPPLADKSAQASFVLDGSFVHNVGELQLNITNWGLIGSLPTERTSFSDAPSAMWPAGSGVDYLFGAGLWVGAIKEGIPVVSTGIWDNEMIPSNDPLDTIYETAEGEPNGARFPVAFEDDDEDGLLNEDPLDGRDNDRDRLIDEDFAAIGDQHFRCVMRDDRALTRAEYPDHEPLGIEVVLETHQWTRNRLQNAVVLNYTITNVGQERLQDVFLGFYVDCDVGPRNARWNGAFDDMIGFYTGRKANRRIQTVSTEQSGRTAFNMPYMYDCDGDGGITPGYIGIVSLGVDWNLSFEDREAPGFPYLRNFRYFAGEAAFESGGEPLNDAERYAALSSRTLQEPPIETDDCRFANDYKFLVSTPAGGLFPGKSLRFQIAIVMGGSLVELKENAAEVLIAYYGSWFDRDEDPQSGILGRESYVCRSNVPGIIEPLFKRYQDCFDPLVNPPLITEEMLDENGCIWVNNDCYFEELRGSWLTCASAGLDAKYTVGCTGRNGREYNVRWWVSGRPPVKPTLRTWETDRRVHLFWDNRSEFSTDDEFSVLNFESYRVWRASGWERPPGTSLATGPSTELWEAIAEFDVVDSFELQRRLPSGQVYTELRPLGPNTGLDSIGYVPRILRGGTHEAYLYRELRLLVDRIFRENPELHGQSSIRYRDASGGITEFGRHYPELKHWESVPTQIDTVLQDRFGVRFYEYVDDRLHNGFFYFHAITAASHAVTMRHDDIVIVGTGQEGIPQNNFLHTVPQSDAQTPEERREQGPRIFVVPNPATREALADFNQLFPNADDPTGTRVEFRNLPRTNNVIRIYTLAGDLVEELRHDGRDGSGSVSWNLVSRNGQQVVSGIYLYSVESEDSRFNRFVGRFVIVN